VGSLDGVRVLDFGQYIAGPLAAMLLADHGADVIHVDPPGGDRMNSPSNAIWNRGKRRITLDLHDPGDLDVARRLVAHSDVVIENFRPGVMAALGLGHDDVIATNRGLIYCSLPGFASDDPRAAVAAWEGVVEAAAGAYGWVRGPDGDEGHPVFSPVAVPSNFAAFLSAISVVMALSARDRDGGAGQRIEVPLYDAMFTAYGYRLQRVAGAVAPPGGLAAVAAGRRSGAFALFGPHQCQDKRWIYFHAGNKNVRDFIAAVGMTEAIEQPDARDRIRELFASQPAAHWEALGAEVRTEVVEFRSSAEWLKVDHARASKMVIEVDDATYGPMVQPGVQARLLTTPGAVRGPARKAGADTDAIRREAAVATPTADPTREPTPASMRPVLDGVKVLDLCIVLAGPTCGRTLAEFGADVIKIEAPGRDTDSAAAGAGSVGQTFNLDINRGKRSIVLDLKTAEGLEVFWRLVASADVVVENFRDGVAEALGIGYEAVRNRRPDIVYASLNMYGYEGPWQGRPGHEQLAQAATGMAVRYGGDGVPLLQHSGAINDYGTGLMGAYAVALALLHHNRTGEGQRVNTSLAYTACLLQALFAHEYAGKEWDEPKGQDASGWGPLQRLYRVADGWLFLGAPDDDGASLAAVEGLQDSAGLSDNELESFLEARLAEEPADVWQKRCATADVGVGAHALGRVPDLLDDPWARAHGLIVTRDHPGLGVVDTLGVTARLSRTPPAPGRPAPVVRGMDGREILDQCGLGSDIDRLVAAGGVHLP
jgi:crotonobetainyl-CoA:carnitine CoA-transferase CaiB-like acyl-CoA transferase